MKPNKKKKLRSSGTTLCATYGKFDIHYFYDDLKENRDMAFKVGVIGVCPVRDRLGVRDNPFNCGCGQACKQDLWYKRTSLRTKVTLPRDTGETIASILAAGMPCIRKHRPLKQEFVRRVMRTPILAGEHCSQRLTCV